MYKIINQSSRSFIVKADSVIKGGKEHSIKNEKIIPPGPGTVEVKDELGASLATYTGILVVEAPEGAAKKKKR